MKPFSLFIIPTEIKIPCLISKMKQPLETVARSAKYVKLNQPVLFRCILSTFGRFFTRSITESAEFGRQL